jgi:ankyrin repeat protein
MFTDAIEAVNNYNPTRSDETLPAPDRHRAFSQAVVEGQVLRIRNFLRMGVDLDETAASGLTVLHRAVLSGHEDVVDILIEAGADVNAMSDDFGTPLCLAALRGAHEVVALLLRWRARASTTTIKLGTALHCCVLGSQGHRANIDALLRAGAPTSTQATIDTRWLQAICEWDGSAQGPLRSPEEFEGCILHDTTPAYIAIRTMQSDLLNSLLPMDLESKFEITFFKATDDTSNSSPHVRSVQERRFDITLPSARHTYLSSSAMTCDLATVRLLIARRASLQSDAEWWNWNITALMIAAGQGSTEIVRLLLDSGALVDTSSHEGWTALHYAAASGNDHTVRILCERGASVDCRDFEGRTPLLVALDYTPPGENYRLSNTLLRANADINACDNQGSTLLHKILRKDQINIVALKEFVKAGANTRLMTHTATSVLKLCMTIPAPGPALMAIGRGLNYGTTFMEIMCDRLNHVRDAYENFNDREHMLVYLSAQAGYEDVAFLLSLGCVVEVIDSDGSTLLPSAVADVYWGAGGSRGITRCVHWRRRGSVSGGRRNGQ